MKRAFFAGAAALVGLAGIPLLAQPTGQGRAEPVSRSAVEAKVRSAFERADVDRDGFVTRDEARAFRQAQRFERREAAFARLDTDNDGAISRDEFVSPQARRGQGERRRHAGMSGVGRFGGGRMFQRLDADSDGRVSLTEATALPLRWFDRADADRDGTVTVEERRAVRRAMRERLQG